MSERLIPKPIESPIEGNLVSLALKRGDFDVEWKLNLPRAGSQGFVELGNNNQLTFTKEGHRLAFEDNWSTMLAMTGDNATLDGIDNTADWLIERLRQNREADQNYIDVLTKSFRSRVEDLKKAATIEELNASNSPWIQSIAAINKTIYHGMPYAENFNLAAPAIAKTRRAVREAVTHIAGEQNLDANLTEGAAVIIEKRLSTHIANFLNGANDRIHTPIKETGINHLVDSILTLDHKHRFQPKGEDESALDVYIKRNFASSIAEAQEREKNIEALTSENISLENFRSQILPPEHVSLREKIQQRIYSLTPISERKKTVLSLTLGLTGIAMLGGGIKGLIETTEIQRLLNSGPKTEWVSPDIEAASVSHQKEVKPKSKQPPSSRRIARSHLQTQSDTETVAALTAPTAQPAKTPEAKPAQEVPSRTPRENLMAGDVSLTNDFDIVLPEELAIIAGLNSNQDLTISLDSIPVDREMPPEELNKTIQDFNDWQKNPAGTLVFRTDIDLNNVLVAHDNGKNLPFEFVRLLYEKINKGEINQEDVVGQIFYLKQVINGKETMVPVRILGFKEVDAQSVTEAGRDYPNDGNPMFIATDSDNLDLNESLRQEGIIHFITCTGNYIPGEDERYTHRVIMSAEIIEQSEYQRAINAATYAVQVLTDAINSADEQGFEHGEVLAGSIEKQLTENGVEINDRLKSKLRKLVNETNSADLQCIMGTELTAYLPGTENWVDIGGLAIKNASDLWKDLETGKKLMDLEHLGHPTDEDGIVRVRIDKVSMLARGDIVATDAHLGQPNGHVARVVDVWIDEQGKYHALVFDVNFAKDGRARIVEITDKNIDQFLANVLEGQKARMIAVRNGKSHEAWRFASLNIRPQP